MAFEAKRHYQKHSLPCCVSFLITYENCFWHKFFNPKNALFRLCIYHFEAFGIVKVIQIMTDSNENLSVPFSDQRNQMSVIWCMHLYILQSTEVQRFSTTFKEPFLTVIREPVQSRNQYSVYRQLKQHYSALLPMQFDSLLTYSVGSMALFYDTRCVHLFIYSVQYICSYTVCLFVTKASNFLSHLLCYGYIVAVTMCLLFCCLMRLFRF